MSQLSDLLEEILENFELDIHEKMFLVAVRCLEQRGGDFKISRISELMGCTENTAKNAFFALKKKGYLDSVAEKTKKIENEEHILKLAEYLTKESGGGSASFGSAPPRSSQRSEQGPEQTLRGFYSGNASLRDALTASATKKRTSSIIKGTSSRTGERPSDFPESVFERQTDPGEEMPAFHDKEANAARQEPNRSMEKGMDRTRDALLIMDMIEEDITVAEAKIILGFANNQVEKVRQAYDRIRKSQVTDKIDALVSILQSQSGAEDLLSAAKSPAGNRLPPNRTKLEVYRKIPLKELE